MTQLEWKITVIRLDGETQVEQAAAEYASSRQPITVGFADASGDGTHISIDEPQAGPTHFKLILDQEYPEIQDLGYPLGTILNDKILEPQQPTALFLSRIPPEEAIIEVGSYQIKVRFLGTNPTQNDDLVEYQQDKDKVFFAPGFEFDSNRGEIEIINRGTYIRLLPEIFHPIAPSEEKASGKAARNATAVSDKRRQRAPVGGSPFIAQFLLPLEATWSSIEWYSQNFYLLIDPDACPDHVLPWLASWFGLHEICARWKPDRQRELLRSGFEIAQSWGTKDMLQDVLRIYFNTEKKNIEIEDLKGENFEFWVTINSRSHPADEAVVREMINLIKPAHTICSRLTFTEKHARGHA
ncbi:MAG: phage tail protein I [Chloroflexota bacterium]